MSINYIDNQEVIEIDTNSTAFKIAKDLFNYMLQTYVHVLVEIVSERVVV